MKRSLRHYEKYFRFNHYISVLKRQPVHMQHVYAAVFAGSITTILGLAILYFDYGLWHERYSRAEVSGDMYIASSTEAEMVLVSSPGDMIASFWKEATEKLHAVNEHKGNILEGKDSYIREGSSQK